jgi:hypothetical protein
VEESLGLKRSSKRWRVERVLDTATASAIDRSHPPQRINYPPAVAAKSLPASPFSVVYSRRTRASQAGVGARLSQLL